MKMFNGLTMGLLNSYRANFDVETGNGGNSTEYHVNYETELPKVQQNVDALKDNLDTNDNSAKEALNQSLTDSFCSGIDSYLKDKKEKKQALTTSLQGALKKHPDEESLKKLKTALGLDSESEATTCESISAPTFNLDGLNTNQIKDKKDGEAENISTYIKAEQPENSEQVDENVNLYQTREKAKKLSTNINTLLQNDKLKDNDNLKKTKDLVDNINRILNSLTKGNIQILQNYIFANLDEDKKEQFKIDNHWNKNSSSFDGKLGKSTLGSLNDLGKKVEAYVDSFTTEQTGTEQSEGAENDIFKDVKVKENIDLPSDGETVEAKNLLDLPEGKDFEVTFKDNKGINTEAETTTQQEVTVIVKSGDKEKTFKITAEVIEENGTKKIKLEQQEDSTDTGAEDSPETQTEPLDTTPLPFNGKQYQVMGNNADLVSKTKLQGVIFYSTLPFEPQQTTGTDSTEGKETQPKLSSTTKEINGEREYYVKLSNNADNNIYKVRVDINGNLNPIIECGDNRILVKNNVSCMQYLTNKLPSSLPGNPSISWDSALNDYVIYSNTDRGIKGLTIEPMTIDGNWVVDGNKNPNHLLQSLSLLNFTNFLRGSEDIYGIILKNDNPDLTLHDNELYVRVNKKSNKKISKQEGRDKGDLGWKWQKVNLGSFGLSGINEETLNQFIKYNNGEHWNDNWDKKDDNKGYNKTDFPAIKVDVRGGGNNPVSNIDQSNISTKNTDRVPTVNQPSSQLEGNEKSELGDINYLSILENRDDVVSNLNIPENVTIYKRNSTDYYYYKEGENIYGVGRWQKFPVRIIENDIQNGEVSLNVCKGGEEALNRELESALTELKGDGEKISIKIENNQYVFVNGEKKIPIDGDILITKDFCVDGNGPKIQDKLKLLYLASKNVPGEFKGDVEGISIREHQADGSESRIAITNEDLSKYGIKTFFNKEIFVTYLNNVSKNVTSDESILAQETTSLTEQPTPGSEAWADNLAQKVINGGIDGARVEVVDQSDIPRNN